MNKMKELYFRAYLNPNIEEKIGQIVIETNAIFNSLHESFEYLGILNFLKKEIGSQVASVLQLKITCSDSGISYYHRVLKKGPLFSISDFCDKLIIDEEKRIKLRLSIKKE